jgi:hypothetical protein
MKTMGKIIGTILWAGSGLLMFWFWVTSMMKWLGCLGLILSFVLTPGFVVFPIVFWIVEGVFPVFYFIMWGMGVLGLITVGLSLNDEHKI